MSKCPLTWWKFGTKNVWKIPLLRVGVIKYQKNSLSPPPPPQFVPPLPIYVSREMGEGGGKSWLRKCGEWRSAEGKKKRKNISSLFSWEIRVRALLRATKKLLWPHAYFSFFSFCQCFPRKIFFFAEVKRMGLHLWRPFVHTTLLWPLSFHSISFILPFPRLLTKRNGGCQHLATVPQHQGTKGGFFKEGRMKTKGLSAAHSSFFIFLLRWRH